LGPVRLDINLRLFKVHEFGIKGHGCAGLWLLFLGQRATGVNLVATTVSLVSMVLSLSIKLKLKS
jgi:hypothetical protein